MDMELNAAQTKIRPVKRLVEDFRSFSISELGRNILRRDRSTEGVFWLDQTSLKPSGRYRINHQEKDVVTLDLSYPSLYGSTHQNVRLETVSVTYGNRPYLLCPSCESRRNKLQISRLGRVACRDCFDLAYQSTRDSHGNPLFRAFRRHMKLRDKQTNVRRVVYNGRYTRKAASVLRLARRLRQEKSQDFGSLSGH